MAGTPPIVANTDFQQWQNWERITTPDGSTTYYVIPGYNGQYVFDPFTSDATGNITIYNNPKPAYDAAAKVQKQQDEAGSTSAQGAQIAGTVAGAATTAAVVDLVKNGETSTIGGLFSSGGDTAANTGAALATETAANTAATQGTAAAANAGVSAVDSAAMQATDAAIQSGASVEAATKAGEQAAAQAGAESGMSNMQIAGKVAQIAGYAYAAYQAYRTLNSDAPRDERAQEVAKQAGLMVANYWTFGLASVADAALMQTD